MTEKDLPLSTINRIIKRAIPANTSISKDAKLALVKASTHYILYATTIASDIATERKRKTISPEDVFQAMEKMDFGEFNGVLEKSLELYRDLKLQKKKDKESSQSNNKEDDSEMKDVETQETNDNFSEEEFLEEEISLT